MNVRNLLKIFSITVCIVAVVGSWWGFVSERIQQIVHTVRQPFSIWPVTGAAVHKPW